MNFLNNRIETVRISRERLTVELLDGRSLGVPLALYPSLMEATPAERAKWRPCGAGTGVYWPLLDYHLSIEGLLRGAPEAPGIRRGKRRQSVAG